MQLPRRSSTSFTVRALAQMVNGIHLGGAISKPSSCDWSPLPTGRLAGLVGRSSGYVESLPAEVKRRVEALKGVQANYTELENQMKREMLELEKKVRKTPVRILSMRHLCILHAPLDVIVPCTRDPPL